MLPFLGAQHSCLEKTVFFQRTKTIYASAFPFCKARSPCAAWEGGALNWERGRHLACHRVLGIEHGSSCLCGKHTTALLLPDPEIYIFCSVLL